MFVLAAALMLFAAQKTAPSTAPTISNDQAAPHTAPYIVPLPPQTTVPTIPNDQATPHYPNAAYQPDQPALPQPGFYNFWLYQSSPKPRTATIDYRIDGSFTVVALTAPKKGWHCFAQRQPWGVVTAGCSHIKAPTSITGFTSKSALTASVKTFGDLQVLSLRVPPGWFATTGPEDSGAVSVKISRNRK